MSRASPPLRGATFSGPGPAALDATPITMLAPSAARLISRTGIGERPAALHPATPCRGPEMPSAIPCSIRTEDPRAARGGVRRAAADPRDRYRHELVACCSP